jgi:carbohydrate diacid regulator
MREFAKAYKEAQIAIEVGKVFDTEKTIINTKTWESGGHLSASHHPVRDVPAGGFQEKSHRRPGPGTLFTINRFLKTT